MTFFETDSKTRQNDLENLVEEKIFDEYKNSTILITGATGLIGSELVLSLLCASRIKNLNIKVVGLIRNPEKAKKIFKNVLNNPNLEIINQDIKNKISYDKNIDYIIHTASITSSYDMVQNPTLTIFTTINGTKNVLDFAKENKMQGVVYLSSLEIYGIINKKESIKEDDFGYIDLTNPRSSYPESKRMAEALCMAYNKEFNLNIKIARLTQTFGAGIDYSDNRVFSQFIKSAVEKKDIILHTKGETIRNYCYLTDAVNGILTILKKGQNKAYNIANKNTAISIKDMAELVVKKCNNIKIKYEIDDMERGYNPTLNAKLDASELEQLGWKPKVNLDEMFEKSISYLKEIKE